LELHSLGVYHLVKAIVLTSCGKSAQILYKIEVILTDTNEFSNKRLTIKEAAQVLHVHENTIRRWCDQGILKCYRIGTRKDRRLPESEIIAFLNSRKD
jgi:excisionase family DNA binding protein